MGNFFSIIMANTRSNLFEMIEVYLLAVAGQQRKVWHLRHPMCAVNHYITSAKSCEARRHNQR